MQACHSQPENHDAICSDAVERLAQHSQVGTQSAYRVAQKGSEALPAISGPAAATSSHSPSKHLDRRAMSESDRATSPVASA